MKSSDIHAASTQLRSVKTDLAYAYTLCFSRPNVRTYEYVVLGLPDPRQPPRLINQGIDEDTRIILTMVKSREINPTLRQTCSRPKPRAQYAFKDLMCELQNSVNHQIFERNMRSKI